MYRWKYGNCYCASGFVHIFINAEGAELNLRYFVIYLTQIRVKRCCAWMTSDSCSLLHLLRCEWLPDYDVANNDLSAVPPRYTRGSAEPQSVKTSVPSSLPVCRLQCSRQESLKGFYTLWYDVVVFNNWCKNLLCCFRMCNKVIPPLDGSASSEKRREEKHQQKKC